MGAGAALTPSAASLARWSRNGVEQGVQTGNAPAYNLRGEHLYLLALARLLYPTAEADEIIVFIAMHSVHPRIYSRPDISGAEAWLGLTRKRGSTTAEQAMLPRARLRRRLFFTQPHPLGIVGTPRPLLIDSDEAGVWVEKCTRSYGKAYSGVAVREVGKYGHGEKWSLILAIDCQDRRWVRFAKVAGTTTEIFDAFVKTILNDLPPPLVPVNPGPQRTFIWDNLGAHVSDQVFNTVTLAGHRVLNRPPYTGRAMR